MNVRTSATIAIIAVFACVWTAPTQAEGLSEEDWQTVEISPSLFYFDWDDQRRLFQNRSDVIDFALEQRSVSPVFLLLDDGSDCASANEAVAYYFASIIVPSDKRTVFINLPYRQTGEGYLSFATRYDERLPTKNIDDEWVETPVPRIIAMRTSSTSAYSVMQKLFVSHDGAQFMEDWVASIPLNAGALIRTALNEYGINQDPTSLSRESYLDLNSDINEKINKCREAYLSVVRNKIAQNEARSAELGAEIDALENYLNRTETDMISD